MSRRNRLNLEPQDVKPHYDKALSFEERRFFALDSPRSSRFTSSCHASENYFFALEEFFWKI
jgi:hypothetical protein